MSRRRSIYLTFLANVFVCSSIYSIHNFIKNIYKEDFKLSDSDSSLLEYLTILRLPASYFIASFATKVRRYAFTVLFFNLLYILTVFLACSVPGIVRKEKLHPEIILIDLILKISDSGIFPIMETILVNSVSYEGSSNKNYSYMRLSTVMGKFLANLSNIQSRFPKHQLGLFYLLLAVPTLISLEMQSDESIKNSEMPVKKSKKFNYLKNLVKILKSKYVLILFSVSLIGVSRVALSNYQSLIAKILLREKGDKTTRLIHMLKSLIIDVPIEFSSLYLENLFGNLWVIFIGATFGFLRAFGYSLIISRGNMKTSFIASFIIVMELFKGFSSTYVGYGCIKINKLYNPPELQTIGQSLYNGAYNAVSACICAMVGHRVMSKSSINEEILIGLGNYTYYVGIISLFGLIPILISIFKHYSSAKLSKRMIRGY